MNFLYPKTKVVHHLTSRDLLEIRQLHVEQTEIADSAANVVAAMLLESHDTDDSLMTTSQRSSRIKTPYQSVVLPIHRSCNNTMSASVRILKNNFYALKDVLILNFCN